MSMQKIGVGTIIENKINSPEGVQVNMSDSGIDVLVLLREPSNDEIGVFEAKQMPFQMKLAVEGDVIFFLFKFGEMPWMDAPFSVHLCTGLSKLPEAGLGHGIAMRVFLIDTKTGRLEALRVIGITNSISMLLTKLVKEQQAKPFFMERHMATIQEVYSRKTTEQLAEEGIGNCIL